ncbi:MAG: ABC-2 family transporter protein [Candidatus Sungbacteria bacterium]|nr:ABC-2 family transporter protein [Candidatus Sungbacteria bacterium]
MNDAIIYLKRTFVLALKENIAYPSSFWMVVVTIPLYAVVQIVFLETIYGQTSNFAGYTKYQAYMLFGTFMMVQAIAHILFHGRLIMLKELIRGDGQESFDLALTKPIDAQVFATLGRFSFGSIVPFFVTVFIVVYGMAHQSQVLNLLNLAAYVFVVLFGVLISYLVLLFFSTLLFWFPELQMADALWGHTVEFGQYPSRLYRGIGGVLLNVAIPVTLMASIPVEFLLGRIAFPMLMIYAAITTILFLLTRLFWQVAIKKYSGAGS